MKFVDFLMFDNLCANYKYFMTNLLIMEKENPTPIISCLKSNIIDKNRTQITRISWIFTDYFL
jgi:hypothetical protein